MRGFYGLSRGDVAAVFSALAGLQHIVMEDRAVVLEAVDAFEEGIDFADALHLVRSTRASSLATFDRRLAARANALRLTPPVELLE
jgi:predicted nucleic-acid-binding protein